VCALPCITPAVPVLVFQRSQQDAFNAELTFSVIVRDTTSGQGYSTLDVECETADLYYLLLRGFRLLQEEAEAHRALQRNSGRSDSNQDSGTGAPFNGYRSSAETDFHSYMWLCDSFAGPDGESDYDLEAGQRSSRNLSARMGLGLLQAQRVEELSLVWNSVKGYVTGGAWEQDNTPQDPISELFAPSAQLDPLRALRVGGGLLPANSTPKAAPSTTGLSSPASPQSPSLLPPDSAVQTNSLPLAQFLGWNSAGTQYGRD
jgi:hypothetical protein